MTLKAFVTLSALILSTALLNPPAEGDHGGAPPPPGGSRVEQRIPQSVRNTFFGLVYPDYQTWIANGNCDSDCGAAFQLYLTIRGTNDFTRWCYTQLYNTMIPQDAV